MLGAPFLTFCTSLFWFATAHKHNVCSALEHFEPCSELGTELRCKFKTPQFLRFLHPPAQGWFLKNLCLIFPVPVLISHHGFEMGPNLTQLCLMMFTDMVAHSFSIEAFSSLMLVRGRYTVLPLDDTSYGAVQCEVI